MDIIQLFQVKTKPNNIEMGKDFIGDGETGFIAIGWSYTGDLKGKDKEGIRARLEKHGLEGQSLRTNLGTINTFVNGIRPGDIVLISDGNEVYIGYAGEYKFENDLHMRDVKWKAKVMKDDLNTKVLSLLRNGTSVTKFKYTLVESGLTKYLDGEIGQEHNKSSEGIDNSKAVEVLKMLLDSDKEEVRLEAAKTLLQYEKR